jgi:hypothetical protein
MNMPLDLSDTELRAALAGDVPTRSESFTNHSGKAAGRGWGAIVIERPLREVWAALSRWDDRPEYIPRLERIEVLAEEPGRARVRQVADAGITTVITTCWFELDEAAGRIGWRLDAGAPDNTPAEVEGDYRMVELAAGRTLLVYRAHVDTGMKIPRAVQAFLQRRAIPDLLRAVKRRVESGGRSRK